jgi:hypothetical protein
MPMPMLFVCSRLIVYRHRYTPPRRRRRAASLRAGFAATRDKKTRHERRRHSPIAEASLIFTPNDFHFLRRLHIFRFSPRRRR